MAAGVTLYDLAWPFAFWLVTLLALWGRWSMRHFRVVRCVVRDIRHDPARSGVTLVLGFREAEGWIRDVPFPGATGTNFSVGQELDVWQNPTDPYDVALTQIMPSWRAVAVSAAVATFFTILVMFD